MKDFAKVAGPLHDPTKKRLKFRWGEDCQSAFEKLKQALTQAPVLAYPDFIVECTLATDARDERLGYFLGQERNNREVVIGYAGRKLLPAEKNYSVTEREALAVVSGIRHFRSCFMEYISKSLLTIVPALASATERTKWPIGAMGSSLAAIRF